MVEVYRVFPLPKFRCCFSEKFKTCHMESTTIIADAKNEKFEFRGGGKIDSLRKQSKTCVLIYSPWKTESWYSDFCFSREKHCLTLSQSLRLEPRSTNMKATNYTQNSQH
jgi:hypothetical protein